MQIQFSSNHFEGCGGGRYTAKFNIYGRQIVNIYIFNKKITDDNNVYINFLTQIEN